MKQNIGGNAEKHKIKLNFVKSVKLAKKIGGGVACLHINVNTYSGNTLDFFVEI